MSKTWEQRKRFVRWKRFCESVKHSEGLREEAPGNIAGNNEELGGKNVCVDQVSKTGLFF